MEKINRKILLMVFSFLIITLIGIIIYAFFHNKKQTELKQEIRKERLITKNNTKKINDYDGEFADEKKESDYKEIIGSENYNSKEHAKSFLVNDELVENSKTERGKELLIEMMKKYEINGTLNVTESNHLAMTREIDFKTFVELYNLNYRFKQNSIEFYKLPNEKEYKLLFAIENNGHEIHVTGKYYIETEQFEIQNYYGIGYVLAGA